MRSADLCLILLDATRPQEYDVIVKEIYDTHIRINQTRPDIKIKKTAKDGIRVGSTVKLTHLDEDTIKAVLKEFRINNADVVLRSDITIDQFIDCIEANKKYMPSLTVLNKADLVPEQELKRIMKKYHADLAISAQNNINTDELRELIFSKLDLIRIYLKEPTKAADLDEPLIVFRNFSVGDVCKKLHKDFVSKFKFARVWGKSAKFEGQKVMLKHHLKEGDILEINLR